MPTAALRPALTAFAAISSGVEIQAVYSGDADFTTSTSSAATQTVNLASTVTGDSTVVNPSVTGQTITATAGLTVASPGSDNPVAPTGTVGVRDLARRRHLFQPRC